MGCGTWWIQPIGLSCWCVSREGSLTEKELFHLSDGELASLFGAGGLVIVQEATSAS